MGRFTRLGERPVHNGQIWDVVIAEFTAPDGTHFVRDIVRSPGSVAVVPLIFDAEGNPSVVMVRQYRSPFERPILEIPAGMRDVPGEPPDATARRELVEEAGLAASEMDLLIDMIPSPGMTDAVCAVFLATGCTPVADDRQGPEEAEMELVHLPLATAIAMVERGEISDAKSVAGLLMTERRLRREASAG